MPRTAKSRRVCAPPKNHVFTPEHTEHEPLLLSVEELESLRLCDLEGLEQEEAAEKMEISRGTLQRILYSARRQVAKALIEGYPLEIGGGNYTIASDRCTGSGTCKTCKFKMIKE